MGKNVWNGKLSLAYSGVLLLCFMTVHLFQFRFGETLDFLLRPPPYLIYFTGILKLQLFWTDDSAIDTVEVRDIYRLEVDRFVSDLKITDDVEIPCFWAGVYILATFVFVFHACNGHPKRAPKPHQVHWLCDFLDSWAHVRQLPIVRHTRPRHTGRWCSIWWWHAQREHKHPEQMELNTRAGR